MFSLNAVREHKRLTHIDTSKEFRKHRIFFFLFLRISLYIYFLFRICGFISGCYTTSDLNQLYSRAFSRLFSRNDLNLQHSVWRYVIATYSAARFRWCNSTKGELWITILLQDSLSSNHKGYPTAWMFFADWEHKQIEPLRFSAWQFLPQLQCLLSVSRICKTRALFSSSRWHNKRSDLCLRSGKQEGVCARTLWPKHLLPA